MRPTPNGPLGGLPSSTRLIELSRTYSSISSFLMRRRKSLFFRLTRMLRCFMGPLTVLPDDLRVPLETNSPVLPVGALPSDPPTSVSRGPTSDA